MKAARHLVPAAALIALLGAGYLQAAVPAGAAKAGPIKITDCNKAAASPTEVTLTCGDGNTVLRDLRWSSFGRGSARAAGRLEMNTCSPTCVEGKVVHYAVTVTATAPKRCPGGIRVYDKLALTFTGSAPHSARSLRHWSLGCPLR